MGGRKHLEISPGNAIKLTGDKKLCAKVVQCASDHGIAISSYTIGANFIQPDSAALKKEIGRVKSEIDTGAMLGVHRMRHDAGWRPIPECTFAQFEKDLPVVADAIRELADYAKQYGIVTSSENHGYLFQGSERVQRLVRTVGRDNYRTTLDIGNFLCADEDPVSAVRNNIGIASHIHFKDFYIRKSMPVQDGFFPTLHGKLLRGAIVGHGDIDIPAVVKVIRESGYDGFISVEFEGMEDCMEGSRIGMQILSKLFAEKE